MSKGNLSNWQPQEPRQGPPLPKFFGIRWPWYSRGYTGLAGEKIIVAGAYAPDGVKRAAQYICTDDYHDEVVINAAITQAIEEGYGIVELAGSGAVEGRPHFIVSRVPGEDYAIKVPRCYSMLPGGYRDTHPLWFRGQGKTAIYLADHQNCKVVKVGDEATPEQTANESAWISDFMIDGNGANQDAGDCDGVYIVSDMNYGNVENVEIISCKGGGFVSINNRYWTIRRLGTHGCTLSGTTLYGGYQNALVLFYAFSNGQYGLQLTSYNGVPSNRNTLSNVHCICNGRSVELSGIGVLGSDNILDVIQAFDELPVGEKTQAYGIEIAPESERTVVGTYMCEGNKYGPIHDASPSTKYL